MRTVSSVSTARSGSYRATLCTPLSITAVTPGTVSDVSAMLVATMTRRRSTAQSRDPVRRRVNEPCSSTTSTPLCSPRLLCGPFSSAAWATSRAPGRKHSTWPAWSPRGLPDTAASHCGARTIRDVERVQPPRNIEDRRVTEKRGHAPRVERRRHDHDPQVVPRRPRLPARGRCRGRRGCCARGTRR